MPTCYVIGCKSRDGIPDRNFFRFPSLNKRHNDLLEISKARQIAWCDALRKRNFLPHQYTNARVCNLHFISGKSARLQDVDNPDWVPTLNMGYEQQAKPQRFIFKQVKSQFSNLTDVQRTHFVSGTNAKLQNVTNSDWKVGVKPSDDKSDLSRLTASVGDDLESSLSFNSNRIVTPSYGDDDHYLKKPTFTEDSNASKTAEVFRDKNGKFSFLCLHCNTFNENCDEMIDHIKSHFDSADSHMDFEMQEVPEPEFISCNNPAEVKLEPEMEVADNETFCEKSEVLNLKSELLSDESKVSNFIKSLPVHRTPQTNSRSSNKYRRLCGDLKTFLTHSKDLRKPTNSPSLSDKHKQSHAKSFLTHSKNLRKPTTVSNQLTISKSKTSNQAIMKDTLSTVRKPKLCIEIPNKEIASARCYQCEMEPPVTNKSNPRRHKCLFCQEWFINHVEFKAHFEDIHNKDTDQFFSLLTNCSEFTCYICEKNFALRSNLSIHMKIHHDKFLEHICPHCGKRFRLYGALTQHMKIHEGITYKCSECESTFPSYVRLQKHLWCHKNESNYVCDLCSKCFKMKQYLSSHMAVHKEARINCRFCDAMFKFSSNRRIHEKSVHKAM